MNKGKLFYCVGLPRCGKSTYCNEWVNGGDKRVIVASDDIRLALHGQRYEKLAETMVFAIKHVMIRALLNRGFDVIVDGTHSSDISVQRLIEIDENAEPIYFTNVTKETCIQRAIDCGQEDLIPAIERIHNNLDKKGLIKNG